MVLCLCHPLSGRQAGVEVDFCAPASGFRAWQPRPGKIKIKRNKPGSFWRPGWRAKESGPASQASLAKAGKVCGSGAWVDLPEGIKKLLYYLGASMAHPRAYNLECASLRGLAGRQNKRQKISHELPISKNNLHTMSVDSEDQGWLAGVYSAFQGENLPPTRLVAI